MVVLATVPRSFYDVAVVVVSATSVPFASSTIYIFLRMSFVYLSIFVLCCFVFWLCSWARQCRESERNRLCMNEWFHAIKNFERQTKCMGKRIMFRSAFSVLNTILMMFLIIWTFFCYFAVFCWLFFIFSLYSQWLATVCSVHILQIQILWFSEQMYLTMFAHLFLECSRFHS